jgi:hypothetical protein
MKNARVVAGHAISPYSDQREQTEQCRGDEQHCQIGGMAPDLDAQMPAHLLERGFRAPVGDKPAEDDDGRYDEVHNGGVSPNRRKFRQVKLSSATIASRSIICPLSRKV